MLATCCQIAVCCLARSYSEPPSLPTLFYLPVCRPSLFCIKTQDGETWLSSKDMLLERIVRAIGQPGIPT
jgi:hypothetical protein